MKSILSIWIGCCLLLFGGIHLSAQTTHVINNAGLTFVPANITIQQGDIINWQISGSHNVVEVSQATYNANMNTPLTGGFSTPFGGGTVTFNQPGTYYYVCTPHASLSMKGIITVQAAATSNPELFAAKLTSGQEVLPTFTQGTGLLTAALHDDTLIVSGSLSNLSSPIDVNIAGGAHIHSGLAGENGGIEFFLTFTTTQGGTAATFAAADNRFVLTPGQIDTLKDRGYYVNIHTTGFGAGELRGQILPQDGSLAPAASFFSTKLYGSNEVPSIMSDGQGILVLDLVEDTLTVSGTFNQLTAPIDLNIAGGAHIHLGQAGENGGIEFFLSPTVDAGGLSGRFLADSNRFILDATQKALLNDRNYYVNIHSQAFGPGELRGQILGMPLVSFRAFLAGAQEVPSVISGGQGVIMVELFTDSLVASGTFQGLGSPYNQGIGSHIHLGLAGSNGGVEVVLNPTLGANNTSASYIPANNNSSLSPTQANALLQREMYVNIHSQDNPTGELRGQLLPQGNYFLYSLLSATQEVTPEVSAAFGAGILEVRGDEGMFTGSFSALENGFNEAVAGGAHLHAGYAGENGPIAFFLHTELNAAQTAGSFLADSNVFVLTEGIRDTIRQRQLYVNIHSDTIVSGELRGQVLGEAQNYFFGPLSGTSELVPVNSTGKGNLAFEWLNGTVTLSGALSELTSPINTAVAGGAHIHRGLAGENGGIEWFLNFRLSTDSLSAFFMADSNQFTLSAGQTDTLISRGYYINIHTLANSGGELRGQILPPANAYFTTSLAGKNETDPNLSLGRGGLKAELVRDQLTISGAFGEMEGDFDVNVAGGAHIHSGQVGTNGGIELLLNVELAPNLKNGTFQADSNGFALSAAQLDLLLADGLYANLHSTTYPSGELRGQLVAETNEFPEAGVAITAPPSGASLTVAGDSGLAFSATWDATTDPDGNPLAYLWELSPSVDFGALILYVNVGANPIFTTDFATIDSILAANGVVIGDSITLYHRASATDGAVCTIGAADSVVLTRGVLTNVPVFAPRQLRVFPSPANDYLQIELSDTQAQDITISIVAQDGRRLSTVERTLTGNRLATQLDVSQLSPGIYQLILRDAQGQAFVQKFIKQ